ncbi:MAG: DUF2738 domain-containing protein [Colwellia sp.]|nr:DUF2738 domain-containing protein [Colwellia sp.]
MTDVPGQLLLTPLDDEKEFFSYGLQENINEDTGIIRYSISACMYNDREGCPKENREWLDGFIALIEMLKAIMVENKDSFNEPELTIAELRKFSPLYYPKNKQTKLPQKNLAPTLYPKVQCYITTEKDEEDNDIITDRDFMPKFYPAGTDDALEDPFLILGQRLKIRPTINVDNIYIGANNKCPQILLYDTEFVVHSRSRERMVSKSSRRITALEPKVNVDDDEECVSVSAADAPAAETTTENITAPVEPPAAPAASNDAGASADDTPPPVEKKKTRRGQPGIRASKKPADK